MYKFHGIVRWSFGWYTPNEVAFMVAELLRMLERGYLEKAAEIATRMVTRAGRRERRPKPTA